MRDEVKYWIGFNIVKGIGPVRLQTLLDAFGDVKSAWQASPAQLRAAGLSDSLARRVQQVRDETDFPALMARLKDEAIQVLTWHDEAYPAQLKEIPQSPPVIYLRGSLWKEDRRAVAIVGTRRFTSYGRQVAEHIARTLAHQRVTIVSGLARGIDGISHQAALDAGGRTIAVLGSGVDHIYPPEHRQLAREIVKSGAVISDYPLGTPPEGQNFPPRNRIISGLSRAVIVVEAGERSGALITARYAADQGREVFAVPGNIFAPQSKGPNALIKQGAYPVVEAHDIMEVLDLPQRKETDSAPFCLPSDPTEAKLFQLLDLEPRHVDEICTLAGLPVEQVTAALAVMEIKGMVRKTGRMEYMAIRESGSAYDHQQEG